MYIVTIAPDCAPVAKAGRLPTYEGMRNGDIWGLQRSDHGLWVPWYGGAVHCTIWFGYVHCGKCFFIEPHLADGSFGWDLLYGYGDDVARFAFFAKAALEFLLESGKRTEVIHCHDSQAGLVPVLLYEQYREETPFERVCCTILNFRRQGLTGPEVLWATQLGRPEYFLDSDRLGDDTHFRTANLMRGGVAYSNFVTTVSTSHVGEARSACEAGRCWGGAAAGIDFPRCATGPSGFFGGQPCSW